mmetsp:Transcript_11447/g.44312  ORF Transcript_11447/g.44312 Transcript_11447/m.44312 type:complete len:202 (-) Transcript_11447:1223-1828(-)
MTRSLDFVCCPLRPFACPAERVCRPRFVAKVNAHPSGHARRPQLRSDLQSLVVKREIALVVVAVVSPTAAGRRVRGRGRAARRRPRSGLGASRSPPRAGSGRPPDPGSRRAHWTSCRDLTRARFRRRDAVHIAVVGPAAGALAAAIQSPPGRRGTRAATGPRLLGAGWLTGLPCRLHLGARSGPGRPGPLHSSPVRIALVV